MKPIVIASIIALAACSSPLTFERQLEGKNATNLPGVIFINPDQKFRAAVWAQEAYEAIYKLNPIGGASVKLDSSAKREMEIRSHEIETQVAVRLYNQDENEYRLHEAQVMQRGYGGLFSNSTVEQIVGRMKGETPFAKRWVDRNWGMIYQQQK